jgi:hypothetical protein
MSLPDRNAPWPTIVKHFTNQKADGESLGVVLKRASHYRKTGKVMESGKMQTKATAKKRGKKSMRGGKSKSDKRR